MWPNIPHRLRSALFAYADSRLDPIPAPVGPDAASTSFPDIRRVQALDGTTRPREPFVGQTVLAASDVRVRFGGNLAVAGASIELRPGEVLGLIGANGAGKSTLLDAMGGFVPAEGRIELLGDDISRLSAARRAQQGLGRTFQAAPLFPTLTVRETILVALEARGRSKLLGSALFLPPSTRAERGKRSQAAELIDLVGLGPFADSTIGELSTGTRRIVELAGLLALDARALCLDEPTAGVAQRETEALAPLLRQVRDELGASMVVIEHDMPFIRAVSDRLYCLEAGQVIAEGLPDDVCADPRVVASYLGTDTRAIERSGAVR